MEVVRSAAQLLERDRELRALEGLIEAALAGTGSVAVVEGPAGIGKSRLLERTGEIASDREMRALTARGDELVMESSFAAVRELLWPAVREAGTDALEGAARLAIPVFEPQPHDADRERVSAVLHGLYWLVADLTARAPLALLIDDGQWLDAASARFVAYLGRRIESLPVLAVIAVRTGEEQSGSELAAQSHELARTVLCPSALSEEASATVIRGILGARADEQLCRSCYEVTRGNPFYLRELAVAIEAEGSRPTVELARRVRSLGSGAISRSVLIRLSRLGEDCERLAEALSVLGPGASLRNVATLAKLDRARARVAADALYGADLLEVSPSLAFIHPIVNEAVSSQLPPVRRASLHGEAAALLTGEGASADRIAAHLLSAEPYGERWVVEALRVAADEALGRGAPEAAVSYLRRALGEPPTEELRLEVLLELGRAEALLPVAQDFAHLREALTLARDPAQRAEIALELALALFGVLRNVDAARVLEAVLEDSDRLDPKLVERLEQPLLAAPDDLAAAPHHVARAKPYLDRVDAGEELDPRTLSALTSAAMGLGVRADRVAELAQRALADERLLTLWLHDGYVTACMALSWTDRNPAAVRAFERGLREAQRRGSAPMFMQLSLLRADAALRAGEVTVAEEYAERGVELARELGVTWAAGVVLPAVLLERGRTEEAAELLERIQIDTKSVNGMEVLANRGRVRIACGQLQPGLADVLEADRNTTAAGFELSVNVDWVPAAVLALSSLGRRGEAVDLASRELELAAAFGAPRRHGVALSVRGSLDPGEHGLAQLREASDLLARSPARVEHARALANLGVGLRERGLTGTARETLARALDLAHRSGAVTLADRARRELIATGARPRRAALTGAQALTPAELRTAQMAAQGLSNREIAQALFVSSKTVETQLSHAYAKLAIGGRSELAAALSASG